MISFLNPLFLAFGGALLIPLVLHMIQSSRTVRLPFSTLRFLKLAEKRSSRRIKMENFLLWLLRTILMALLTLAFAMPMIRTKDFGNLLGRAARDVAIVIDASYSTQYKIARQEVWAQMMDTAASLIEGLSEKDRFCVFLAGDQVTPLCEQLTDKREETAGRLRSLKPSTGSSQLCPAVQAALKALEADAGRNEREIHIISDTQALPWSKFKRADQDAASVTPVKPAAPVAKVPEAPKPAGEGKPVVEPVAPMGAADNAWDPTKLNDRITSFVTLLGAPEPENTAPVGITLEPKLITAETPCKITARLLRTGPPQETAVTLFLDGKETARRSVKIGGGAGNEVQFMIPPVGPGAHELRVETPEDGLVIDNPFYFLIRAKEKLPALCVGSKDSTFFMRAALAAAVDGVSTIDVKYVQPDQLAAETIQGYVCIFLCNALPLPGQEMARLEQYVKAGGVLAIFPGDGAAPADYAAWTCLPALPSEILELPVAQRKRTVNWDKPQHLMFVALKEGGVSAPVMAIKRQLKCETRQDKAEVLASTGAGYPFILSRPTGRGEVFLFTVAPDRSWSDFPLSPFYLPVIHQLVHYAAGASAFTPFLWTTDSLPLQEFLPEAGKESVLKNPEGKAVPVRSTVAEGQTQFLAEGLTLPGIYTLSDAQDPAGHPALAFNISREESDLTPVHPDDIPAILGVKTVQVATSKDDLFRKLEDFRVGKTLGEPLLWLVLLLAVLEVLYANWLMRKGSKLTDTMVVDPSGKVRGKD